jgi:hypothetical protein
VKPVPNPGSPEAVKKGCLCPVMDNRRGRGCGRTGENGDPLFYMDEACPVHRPSERAA